MKKFNVEKVHPRLDFEMFLRDFLLKLSPYSDKLRGGRSIFMKCCKNNLNFHLRISTILKDSKRVGEVF